MNGSRHWLLSATLALALASTSCHFFRRSKASPPPPPKPAPRPTLAAPPPRPPSAPTVDPASIPLPVLEPGEPDLTQSPPLQAAEVPPPPRRRGRAREATEGSKQADAEAQQSAPMPQLEQILTPEEQHECNQSIDRSIGRAQRNLAALGGRRLDANQTTSVERIKTFINQAIEARRTDLLLARSLAERADVLAEDLLRSTQ